MYCRYAQVHSQICENIQQADSDADLKWWSVNRGPEMSMSWPTYEVFVDVVWLQYCWPNCSAIIYRALVFLFCDHNLLTTE